VQPLPGVDLHAGLEKFIAARGRGNRFMKRQNIYFGFGPAPKGEPRLTLYRRPKSLPKQRRGGGSGRLPRSARSGGSYRADLVSALVNLGYSKPAAKKAAGDARGEDFDSQLRDALTGLKKNPMSKKKRTKKRRQFPGLSGLAARALRKLAAQRRRNSGIIDRKNLVSALMKMDYSRSAARKGARLARGGDFDSQLRDALRALDKLGTQRRHNSRMKKTNGKMPAGLRKYWAKKRRKKTKAKMQRRTTKRRRTNPRVIPFRKRKLAKTSRRRRARPASRRARTVKVPFRMTPVQTKKYARALSRATGKKVVIV
jgi:hypothetical protein